MFLFILNFRLCLFLLELIFLKYMQCLLGSEFRVEGKGTLRRRASPVPLALCRRGAASCLVRCPGFCLSRAVSSAIPLALRKETGKVCCLLLLIRDADKMFPLCRFSLWPKVSSWLSLAAWIMGPWQGRSTQGVLTPG